MSFPSLTYDTFSFDARLIGVIFFFRYLSSVPCCHLVWIHVPFSLVGTGHCGSSDCFNYNVNVNPPFDILLCLHVCELIAVHSTVYKYSMNYSLLWNFSAICGFSVWFVVFWLIDLISKR